MDKNWNYSNTTDVNGCPYYAFKKHSDPEYADCIPDICDTELDVYRTWLVRSINEFSKIRLLFQDHRQFQWIFAGVISLCVAVLGLTGNLVAAIVLLQDKLKNAFNQLLMILASFDGLFLIFNGVGSLNHIMVHMNQGKPNKKRGRGYHFFRNEKEC